LLHRSSDPDYNSIGFQSTSSARKWLEESMCMPLVKRVSKSQSYVLL
jgi:hypothetical protein